MPILRIRVDDIDTEFKIIPLNKTIYIKIEEKYSYTKNGVILLDRCGLLSHVVKEPKMNKKDWEELPSSMISKILRNIRHYIKSISEKEHELRIIYMQQHVYEEEIDDLFRYLEEGSDDWAWNRIKDIENFVKSLEEKRKRIVKSLEAVKSDKVIFDKDKEVDYDVQPLQLENRKE